MFEDGRVLRAPLPATGPGAVVEQEVTVRETGAVLRGRHGRLLRLRRSRCPCATPGSMLEAPAGLPLRWVVRSTPGSVISGARRAGTGAAASSSRRATCPPTARPSRGCPPEVPRGPPTSAFSTGRSWSDLARRYSDIVDRAHPGARTSRAFLQHVPGAPAASQVETIDRLSSPGSGDEVRYTGVELGDGGVIPRTPAETLKRRFGDCKDKAVLLTALLRALDIPAYVALLNAAEDEPDVEESLPGFGVFNHAIVVVPGNPAIWIDPTDPYARAGELPVADQGRLALIASPTATGLVRTPRPAPRTTGRSRPARSILADLGRARVVETTEYLGGAESSICAPTTPPIRTTRLRASLAAYAGRRLPGARS